ncbi:MAG: extracellular solute-binding protein [Candidatus Magasanikbacteria bacterium]|nr:extracellular solute-binding protein [Candidatus Magasanikbacteria bacterium]
MKMGNRFLAIFLIASIFLTLGFGCKGLSTAEVAATKPVTLEMWTSYDDVDALQGILTKYRALRPYLKVNIRQMSPSDMYTRLVEELAEDRGPDIISINSRTLGLYVSKLSALPPTAKDITVLVEKGTLGTNTTVSEHTVNLPTAAQIDDNFVQAVGKSVVRGGSAYGLPLSLDTMAIYYNKDLLDRSGVPEPPKTWDDFQVAAKKITKYNRADNSIIQAGAALGTGNNVPNSDDLLYILLKQSDIDFTSRSGQAVFNMPPSGNRREEPPAVSVINFYTDFANPGRDTYSWSENMPNALDAFVNGQVGFFFGFSYYNSIIRGRAPQLNYRILPLLQLNPDKPVNAANFSMLSVVNKSKNKDAAFALIQYLTYSEATKDYLAATKRPTAVRSLIAAQKEDASLEPFVSQVLVAESWYTGSNYSAATKALVDMFHEWLLPPPDPNRPEQWRGDVLNRAAAKINQTI